MRNTAAPSAPAHRLLFIDCLRGLAVLVMMETHVFNVALDGGLRDSKWFYWLNFVNGLVAPSFLFVAGFVFFVMVDKKADVLRRWGPLLFRELRRIALIFALAYAMRMPSLSWRKLWHGGVVLDWRGFYKVDVLHCISATWILLLVAMLLLRRTLPRRLWLLGTAAAMVMLTPYCWRTDFVPDLSIFVAAYLNPNRGSLFPLLPWSAFMLAGALCASFYLGAKASGRERAFIVGLSVSGLALFLTCYNLPLLGVRLAVRGTNWAADPRGFFVRLGLVLGLVGLCWGFVGVVRRTPQALLDLSRESLFVYVVHLWVLYSRVWHGQSVADRTAQALSPSQCVWLTLLLVVLMLVAARGWSRVKQWRWRWPGGAHAPVSARAATSSASDGRM